MNQYLINQSNFTQIIDKTQICDYFTFLCKLLFLNTTYNDPR